MLDQFSCVEDARMQPQPISRYKGPSRVTSDGVHSLLRVILGVQNKMFETPRPR